MFRTVHLSIIKSFSLYTQQWYTSYSSQAVSKPVWHITLLCVQEKKTLDDGQRNCPKHVEFYSKNKFEKLVHLVGFIIRNYHDARSPERQNNGFLASWGDTLLNPLNAELNPICHLLALLEAHHILHVSRIRVKWTFCRRQVGRI